ncbi:MAG: serine/threonine-protein kinase [Planctomycetaceae bacterium]
MPTSTCNPETIDDFLADRLDEVAQRSFEQHLDECDHCGAELKRRTADVTLWNDARAFLSSSENPALASCATHFGDSVRNSSDALRLDFLNPTDDPHMLGRFAGYEISGVIGCGGMGIVLKGFDASLNRYAAIKVLAPHYATTGAARQRFAREAQAAAAVVHDNVIAIHGVSEFNNLPYLIMPYLKGQSLQKRVDQHGPLSVPEILRIAMQTARGLAAAHDQGLVHRDIKPANILLPENVERVLITDFGLARAADDASLTRSGVIAGTPQYMSPEQAKGEGIDHRSDLFSLGSVMYTMATGHPPFRAETPYGILRRITDNAHRPVHELRSDVPLWLCSIIHRLLRKNAADRFRSADEVASLLEDCLAHVQQPSQVPLPLSLKPTAQATRHLRWPIAVAGILLTCAAIVLFIVPGDQNKPDSSLVAQESLTVESADQPSETTDHQDQLEPADNELQWSVDSDLDDLESTLQRLRQEML